MTDRNWAIALHGGAGTILKANMTDKKEVKYREGLSRALAAGSDILLEEGSSLDAVEATVNALEDNPLFNAGRGSVLTSDATFELDACIMDGRNLDAGAVINVGHIRNPVTLARLVMESSAHVALTGEGAERFARAHGIEIIDPSYFDTPLRREQLEKAQASDEVSLDHSDYKYGTVGAVARDGAGHLAAATSTGGMTNKKPGRVGDSPMIGAGTYASDKSCAVSATGHGEMFIRMTVARDIAALMEYADLSLDEAVARKVMTELPMINGSGGVIAVGPSGPPVLNFNSAGMYRAMQCEGEAPQVAIFVD